MDLLLVLQQGYIFRQRFLKNKRLFYFIFTVFFFSSFSLELKMLPIALKIREHIPAIMIFFCIMVGKLKKLQSIYFLHEKTLLY